MLAQLQHDIAPFNTPEKFLSVKVICGLGHPGYCLSNALLLKVESQDLQRGMKHE